MRRSWHWASALLLALASGGAAADSIDINLHDKAIRATYGFNPTDKRNLDLEVGHYFNEDDDFISHLGLLVSGENWSQRGVFDIGLGGRVIYAHAEAGNDSFNEVGVAFGGRVRFSPVQRLGFGASAFYAPEIVTFMDGENYLETSVSVDYQVLPQGFVYVGYRKIEIDFDDVSDVEFDDKVHVGMRLLF